MEAEIGPLIPFWCESTFTAENLSSFSGFNQKKQQQSPIFIPSEQQEGTVWERVDANKEGNLFLSTDHNSWNKHEIKIKPPNDDWGHKVPQTEE